MLMIYDLIMHSYASLFSWPIGVPCDKFSQPIYTLYYVSCLTNSCILCSTVLRDTLLLRSKSQNAKAFLNLWLTCRKYIFQVFFFFLFVKTHEDGRKSIILWWIYEFFYPFFMKKKKMSLLYAQWFFRGLSWNQKRGNFLITRLPWENSHVEDQMWVSYINKISVYQVN